MSAILAVLKKAAGSLLFRAAITLALLGLVFARLDWSQMGNRIVDGDPLYGISAVVCLMGAVFIGAWRWGALLSIAGIHLPNREIGRIYLISVFANAFLPTSVGGDVARPLMVARRGAVLVRAATTVLIERLVALVALITLAWVGVMVAPDAIDPSSVGALAAFSAGLVAAITLLALRPSLVRRLATAVTPARFGASIAESALIARAFLRSPPRILAMIAIQSVVYQVLVTIQLVFLARMIGVDLPFGLSAVALALVSLAMLLPISVGGFGVREGSYVVVLAGGGISHTDAVLISLLSVVALFFATLPGAFTVVRSGFRPAGDPTASEVSQA